MKKFKAFFCLLLTVTMFALLPLQAYAATIRYQKAYIPLMNEYVMNFSYPTGTTSYNLHFVATNSDEYDLFLDKTPTGKFYLTCRGVYSMQFYDADDVLIGSFDGVETPKITAGSCQSYTTHDGSNDLNATANGSSNGNQQLTWFNKGGHTYDVYRNGELVSEDNMVGYYVGPPGNYTIIEKDAAGSYTGKSDITAPLDYVDSGGTVGTGDDGKGDNGDCSTLICQCIAELKPILNEINENTNNQLLKLDELKTSVDAVKQSVDSLKPSIDAITEQLQPTGPYPMIKPIEQYPMPSLEDNKPVMPTESFEDDTVYFEDQGDAASPESFAPAPEPETTWKDHNGDEVEQDEQLTREPVLEMDPVPTRQPSLIREPVLEVEPNDYDLRWKSEQYPN